MFSARTIETDWFSSGHLRCWGHRGHKYIFFITIRRINFKHGETFLCAKGQNLLIGRQLWWISRLRPSNRSQIEGLWTLSSQLLQNYPTYHLQTKYTLPLKWDIISYTFQTAILDIRVPWARKGSEGKGHCSFSRHFLQYTSRPTWITEPIDFQVNILNIEVTTVKKITEVKYQWQILWGFWPFCETHKFCDWFLQCLKNSRNFCRFQDILT